VFEKISSEVRLNAALEYLMQFPDVNLNKEKFEAACGVGIVVSDAMIKDEVSKVVSAAKVIFLILQRGILLTPMFRRSFSPSVTVTRLGNFSLMLGKTSNGRTERPSKVKLMHKFSAS